MKEDRDTKSVYFAVLVRKNPPSSLSLCMSVVQEPSPQFQPVLVGMATHLTDITVHMSRGLPRHILRSAYAVYFL